MSLHHLSEQRTMVAHFEVDELVDDHLVSLLSGFGQEINIERESVGHDLDLENRQSVRMNCIRWQPFDSEEPSVRPD